MRTGSVPDEPMLRKTSLRLTDALYRAIEEEAQREGVSVAQYIRDSALHRVAYAAGQRGDDAEMRRVVRELVEAEREERG